MTKTAYLITGLLAGALLASLAFAGASNPSKMQDPAKVAPQMYKVVLHNKNVRVIDYHLARGEKEPMHSHPSGVLVYFFTDATTRSTLPDGKAAVTHNRAGDVVWRDPVTHQGENVGGSEVHTLLVEAKILCK